MSIKTQITETSAALSPVVGVKVQDIEKVLKWWVWHSPPDWHEDSCQEYATAILADYREHLAIRSSYNAAKLYRRVKNVASNIWHRWHVRQHLSLDAGRATDDGPRQTLRDYLIDAVDYEQVALGNVEAARIWHELPTYIQRLVSLRLQGQRLGGGDYRILRTWAQSHGQPILAEYSS